MDHHFALHLCDLRLLQTLRLLESTFSDHPDRAVVFDALEAISASRSYIADLSAAPEISCECCA